MALLRKTLALPFFSMICIAASAQMNADQQQAIVLKRMIERNHYSPRAVNDSFSSSVFDKVIKDLGRAQFMFTAGEYNKLSSYRYKIDDELNGSSWQFLNALAGTYSISVKRADSLIKSILQKPLDFTADDVASFKKEKTPLFPTSIADMQKLWTKWFKYQMLNKAYDVLLAQENKTSLKEVLTKNSTLLQERLKKTALADLQQWSTPQVLNSHLRTIYLNAIATSFDPHTAFFSPQEKEDFQEALSTEEKSFGLLIDEKEGAVVIQHLVPGGPAWKSGELHRNDQLLQINFDGKEDVDVTMLSADEVAEMIEDVAANVLSIKIKKTDGSLKTVSLRKEKIAAEENRVKGYVLKGSKRIGYISLPDFYTTWDGESGSSCAEDVAKEIVNLKKEGIEGLMLDVRFNGGGSMQEALQLIGIFINEGPLLGTKEKGGKVSYLKDPNRGTIYDGPMVVLINGQSASASEALAASLQDYNRAIVVGSPSYGKATIQQMFPLDTTAGDRMTNSAFGFAKITIGKFYRLDGGSAQWNGVVPHVYLPDAFDAIDIKEKFMHYALSSDTVKANTYYKPLQPLPAKELEQLSSQRTANNTEFADVKTWIKQYANWNKQDMTVPLKPEAFEKWRSQYKEDVMSKEKGPNTIFTAINHQYELERLKNNTYAAEVNDIVIKNLQQDIYIKEAFQILSDLVQRSTPK